MTRVWASGDAASRAVRAGLAPAAALYGMVMRARRRAYGRRWLTRERLPLPSVGVGGLQVGGAGKTPVAAWIAGWFAERGVRPAILLRGYGGDEGAVHRALVPSAVVLEDPDRLRAARRAATLGAAVLVLDDAFQHLRVHVDRTLLLVAAEAFAPPIRLLPAGPWREGLEAATEADLVVVTRKVAPPRAVVALQGALRTVAPGAPQATAQLAISGWRALDGSRTGSSAIRPHTPVLALSGVADGLSFVTAVGRLAHVRASIVRRDHARYDARQVRRIARSAEAAKVDYVVTTAKDAVKLRGRWPGGAPPVLVAQLAVAWEHGYDAVARALVASYERRTTRALQGRRPGGATRIRVAGMA